MASAGERKVERSSEFTEKKRLGVSRERESSKLMPKSFPPEIMVIAYYKATPLLALYMLQI